MFAAPDWLREGETPDYRFSLANERTFLAWIRTALALVAGSVAVVQLVPHFSVSWARTVLGVALATGALALAALAYVRWAGSERAMRLRTELPYPRLIPALAVLVFAVSAGVLILVLIGST
jgi:putative membrane protein